MTTANFDQLWEAARSLAPDEMLRLRNLLDALLQRGGKPFTEEHELGLALLKDGLMSSIPPAITDFTPYQRWKPVEIKGKPLSETIIEERR